MKPWATPSLTGFEIKPKLAEGFSWASPPREDRLSFEIFEEEAAEERSEAKGAGVSSIRRRTSSATELNEVEESRSKRGRGRSSSFLAIVCPDGVGYKIILMDYILKIGFSSSPQFWLRVEFSQPILFKESLKIPRLN